MKWKLCCRGLNSLRTKTQFAFLLWVRNPGAVNTHLHSSQLKLYVSFRRPFVPPWPSMVSLSSFQTFFRKTTSNNRLCLPFHFNFHFTLGKHCKEMKTEGILMHAHSSCRKRWFMLVILIKGHERQGYQRVRRWLTCDNACLTSHKKGQVCPCQLAFRTLCKFVLGGRKQISW